MRSQGYPCLSSTREASTRRVLPKDLSSDDCMVHSSGSVWMRRILCAGGPQAFAERGLPHPEMDGEPPSAAPGGSLGSRPEQLS